MAQKESTFLNMVLTLMVVTLVSAAILGFVHDLTKDAIVLAKTKAQEEAIVKVLPAFDKLGEAYRLLPEEGGDSLEFFPAYNAADELVGIAVKTYTNKGFSGYIGLMAGFAPDGVISGYSVLEHKETPGLGSKMDAWFNDPDKPNQNIIGKNPATTKFAVSKDGGEIDAITASTISSRAFLDGINRAYNTYMKNKDTASGTVLETDENKGGDL
ncbi:MAG: RnfABCDGE type electron transport complex subunit G [Prolixibacteraceae bacterium]|jgi:electron transport complex protein RnfG|nr:RnfABCDGE type electron transport complex subunit G [Prolixibacteraceae bacterium]